MSPYELWLYAYSEVYEMPSMVSTLACPNCGAHELQLRFVVYDDPEGAGHAALWCCRCLHGVVVDRSVAPPGGIQVPYGDDGIPNYRIVSP